MPRSWQFPRWRHMVMQSVMWVAFGASVGVAALVDHHLRQAMYVTLGAPVIDGPITFQLPVKWEISQRTSEGGATLHMAVEQNGESRTITIIRQRVDRLMPPLEYLHASGQLPGHLDERSINSVTIAGWPAQLVHWEGLSYSPDGVAQQQVSVTYAFVLPAWQAITIRLEKNRSVDTADIHLLEQILGSIKTPGLAPGAARSIDLPGGCSISLPADCQVYPQPDPLRESRSIVRILPQGGWVSAQCVPIILANELNDSSIKEIIAAREQFDFQDFGQSQRWQTAVMKQIDANHLLFDPRDPPQALVHRLAYVCAGTGNQALLVVLTAQSPADANDIDQLWKSIQTRIIDTIHLKSMAAEGAKIASVVPPQPLGESWWLWSRGGIPGGYSHAHADPGGIAPMRETVRITWQGVVTHVQQRWGVSSAASGSSALCTLTLDRSNVPVPQHTEVYDSGIRTTIGDSESALTEESHVTPFVMSWAFPAILSRVGDAPAAFWTDRFIGNEQDLLPTPILLLAHRVDSGKPGLRCVEVEISGMGQTSRWYFTADGMLDHAQFPGDLILRPVGESEIQSALKGNERLTIPQP